jgi:hypothetical protein
MPETLADRLRAAAGRIRDHFGRGELCDEDGNVCAIGAVLDVRTMSANDAMMMGIYSDVVADNALTELHLYLIERHLIGAANAEDSFRVDAITMWNDLVVRDGDEAATVMEKAAASWEERA